MQKITFSFLLLMLFSAISLHSQCTTGTPVSSVTFTPNYSGNAETIDLFTASNGKYHKLNVLANRFYTFYAYKTGDAEQGYQDYITITDDQGFYLTAGYSPLVFKNFNYTGEARVYYHTNEACQTNSINKTVYVMSSLQDRFPPTNLTINNVSTNSVSFSWQWDWIGSPPTNGYQYHIIEAPGSFSLPLPPSNSSDSAFTGFSATTSATVSNLNPNKRYHYWVRSNYNGQYSVWMQGGEFFTSAVVCNQPTNLSVNNITANSAFFTWNAPSPAPSHGYEFAYNLTGLEPNASQTSYPLNTSTLINNLSSNTTYYYFVRSNCNTVQSTWLFGGSFTTPQGLNCNGAFYGLHPTATFTPTCTGSPETIVSNAKAGEYSNVNVLANKQYTFGSSIATDYLTITNESGTVSYAAGITPLVWQSGVSAETVRFFLHSNSSCGNSATLRTRTISCAPSAGCAPPTNLSTFNVGVNQASISWTASTSNPSFYDVYFSINNTAPTSGTTPNGSIAATSATINNLTPSTTYYYWVRSNCEGLTSAWISGGSFSTLSVGACNTAFYGLYPDATFSSSCTGTAELIVDNAWAGEYANVNVLANRSYTFSSSVTTDYITITNAAGTTILASGLSPLSWNSATNNGVFRYYLHANANCGNQNVNRSRFISCQTTAPSCGSPSGISFSVITSGTATATWTAASPVPSNGYDVYLSTSSTAPIASTTPSGNVTGTSANLNGLLAGTVYYVWVRANCGATQSTWISGGSFTTLTANGCTTAVYGLFPDATFTPTCSGTAELIVNNAWAGEYSNVTIVSNRSYTFSSSTATDYITITNVAGTTVLAHGVSPLSWNSAANNGVFRYYLHTNASCGNQDSIRSRFISCQAPAGCADPSNINIIFATANSASYLWTAANPVPVNGYHYYISTSSTPPNASTIPTGSVVNQTTVNVFGLTSNTLYYFWLRSNCSPTPGTWISGGAVNTQGTSTFCSTAVYGQHPATTFTPACTETNEIIVNNARAGEFTAVNILPNKQYTFTSSVTSDYLTITNSSGTALVISGLSPLTWNSGSTSGVLRYYLHADGACSFENANRTRSIMCVNALSAPDETLQRFTVYPNPTGSVVTIKALQTMMKIEVINSIGQLITTQTGATEQTQVDLSAYPNGVYLFRIHATDGIETVKVVKR